MIGGYKRSKGFHVPRDERFRGNRRLAVSNISGPTHSWKEGDSGFSASRIVTRTGDLA